jgi:hypothetical protein
VKGRHRKEEMTLLLGAANEWLAFLLRNGSILGQKAGYPKSAFSYFFSQTNVRVLP